MSSISWMKMTAQRARSMIVHLERLDREQREHSNKHIDKSMSHLNEYIGCSDYSDALQKMNERTKEVDAIQPPKRKVKDRVVSCMLEIKCPLEIQEQGRDKEYFEVMYKAMQEYFGIENVHGMCVHRDEQHTYIGKDHQEYTSLYHAHCLVSAYTPEKGINGKAFETRARLHEFNDMCNLVCKREFGIELNTHGLAGKQSVEYLKEQNKLNELGRQTEITMDNMEQLQHEAAAIQSKLEEKTQQIDRELKKYDRMGKTWTGKKKDRIELNRDEYENIREYMVHSVDIEEEQAKEQKRLDRERKQLESDKEYITKQREELERMISDQQFYINKKAREYTKELDDKTAQLEKQNEKLQETLDKYKDALDYPIEKIKHRNETKFLSMRELYIHAVNNDCSLSESLETIKDEFVKKVEDHERSLGWDR